VVSTENRDLGYTPPPGVFDQADRRDANLQLASTQINERSLRLLATGLETGQRAEAFTRFTTEGDKNFLKYRKLRTWARGRGPGWEDGDLHFYIKAGKDQNNFYLYHAPARTSSWEPEVVVDFDRWLALRARIEQAWLKGDAARCTPDAPIPRSCRSTRRTSCATGLTSFTCATRPPRRPTSPPCRRWPPACGGWPTTSSSIRPSCGWTTSG